MSRYILDETLVLVMKTKNDVEIIRANIEYHKKVGVDAFVIMDDGSTDGTREVLGDLRKDGNMLLFDNPVTTSSTPTAWNIWIWLEWLSMSSRQTGLSVATKTNFGFQEEAMT